jgi:poly(3-hydroxybutyrate) depolymerase
MFARNMTTMRLIVLICIFLPGTCILNAQQIDYKGFPQWTWGKKDSTEYYLYTPTVTDKETKHPIVLFLHGCCGTDYHATLRNAVDPPVRLWHSFGENQQRIPTYILSPKTSAGWRQHFANIKAVIDKLVSEGRVDPQRIYISGFSMGAQGTWQFIESYPGYFAAAIPMGMDFKGKDPANFKDMPVWAIRGDRDWWARHLGTQIKKIRQLTYPEADSSESQTGVNPRLTNFEGMEHVVMWPAVKELDLRSWMYAKVNDGNRYPSVILISPAYNSEFKEGEIVRVKAKAVDPDGTIIKTEFFLNNKKLPTSFKAPMEFSFQAKKGDSNFRVVVYDNKGKSAAAEGKVRVNIPVQITTKQLPTGYAGKFLSYRVSAIGNGKILYTLADADLLPEGLTLATDGTLQGVPGKDGFHSFVIKATDEDGDETEKAFELSIESKDPSVVVVTNIKTYNGVSLPIAIVDKGVSPHLRGDDEVTFSGDLGKYAGMMLIRTVTNDSTTAKPHYLQFDADENITVYVAYEKLDNPHSSTVPDWLKSFRREEGQLVTQYYYYDIYSKDFPKGHITLPDAQEKRNGVNNNYFVMFRKTEKK